VRFGHLLARMWLQPFYVLLERIVNAGQNLGFASSLSASGERAALRWLAKRLPGAVTVFDGGANTGEYTAEALSAFGSRADIHCFEPSNAAFSVLARRFSGAPNVHLHRTGLSNESRTAPIYGDATGAAGYSLSDRNLDHLGRTFHEVETVSLQRIDDLCRDLDVTRIDLLKLDVEGHELAALEGAGALLESGAIWAIQFEFGGTNIDSRTFFRDFWQLLDPRYKIHRILWDGLLPIEAYQERLETFLGANYLAITR
jgi:FkbM family methyltransferase